MIDSALPETNHMENISPNNSTINTNIPCPNKLSPKITHDVDRISPLSASTPTPINSQKLSPGDLSTKSTDNSEVAVGNDLDLMMELDISKYIVLKKVDEDGPEIRGGYIDALIIHATKSNKKGN